MTNPALLLVPLAMNGALAAAPAGAQRHGDQMSALQQRQAGRILSLPEIERRVVPGMTRGGAQYIGMEFDGSASIYTLKFLRDGQVIWVDVDGRSGQVLGRTGQ